MQYVFHHNVTTSNRQTVQKVETPWRAARRSCHWCLWPLRVFGRQLIR